MAALDKYSVIAVQQMSGRSVANCFFVDVLDDSGVSDTPASINTRFTAAILDVIKGNQSSSLMHECLLIRKVAPTSEPAQVFPNGTVGGLALDPLPVNQAMCINHVSNDGRPPFRGRWFIAGIPEIFVTEGRFTMATNTSWAPFRTAVINTFGIAGETYQLNHYSDAQDQYDPIVRARLSAVPRKMRGRTPGICSIS